MTFRLDENLKKLVGNTKLSHHLLRGQFLGMLLSGKRAERGFSAQIGDVRGTLK